MVYSNHQDQDQLQKSVELSKKKSQLVERSSAQWTVGTASVNIFCSVCSGRESSGESTRGKSSPHPPSPSPPSWMGRPVRGEGVMWRQLCIHFGRFLYVWTFSFSNKIKNKIRWQAQIQIQIKIKTRGNSIVYILYYIYCVIYLNKSEDVECCLFTSMFRVSTHQMGFHHRENVNVQHFKICKNLIFTLSPTQTWVNPCQICMFFLDPLIKCYFCVFIKIRSTVMPFRQMWPPLPIYEDIFNYGYILGHIGGQICRLGFWLIFFQLLYFFQ